MGDSQVTICFEYENGLMTWMSWGYPLGSIKQPYVIYMFYEFLVWLVTLVGKLKGYPTYIHILYKSMIQFVFFGCVFFRCGFIDSALPFFVGTADGLRTPSFQQRGSQPASGFAQVFRWTAAASWRTDGIRWVGLGRWWWLVLACQRLLKTVWFSFRCWLGARSCSQTSQTFRVSELIFVLQD